MGLFEADNEPPVTCLGSTFLLSAVSVLLDPKRWAPVPSCLPVTYLWVRSPGL